MKASECFDDDGTGAIGRIQSRDLANRVRRDVRDLGDAIRMAFLAHHHVFNHLEHGAHPHFAVLRLHQAPAAEGEAHAFG